MTDSLSIGETFFETERLRLEPLLATHAAELIGLYSDPEMYHFIPQDPPESMTVLEKRFRALEPRKSPSGEEDWCNWAVRLKGEEKCVGVIQVTIWKDGRAQIGYEIGAPYWRRGYASEACGRLIEAMFAIGVPEVYAELDTRNEASIRLLEKLGFRRGAFKENADYFKGAQSDEWTYTLAKGEREKRLQGERKNTIRNGSARI